MPDYSIFGSCLRSEIAFPELRTAINAAPRWRLEISRQRHPPVGTALLGTDDIGGGVAVRLYKLPGGYLLEYDDNTGSFEVSADGGLITWFPVPNADSVMVRLHVIGRVLATALHAAGLFCLHGSGVVVEGGAIGFLAPRFWGKVDARDGAGEGWRGTAERRHAGCAPGRRSREAVAGCPQRAAVRRLRRANRRRRSGRRRVALRGQAHVHEAARTSARP